MPTRPHPAQLLEEPSVVALGDGTVPFAALLVGITVLGVCVALMAQALPAVDRPAWRRGRAARRTVAARSDVEPHRLAVTGRRPALGQAPPTPSAVTARPRPIVAPPRQGPAGPDTPGGAAATSEADRTIEQLFADDPAHLARAIRLLLNQPPHPDGSSRR